MTEVLNIMLTEVKLDNQLNKEKLKIKIND